MPFDRRAFNKLLKNHFTAQGYTMHKNRKDCYIDAPDGVARLVVRLPDGIHGFWFGVQFADRGFFSGDFAKTSVRWYICETVLGGALVNDYSSADIAAGLEQVTATLAPFVAGGKAAIAAHLNDFFGDDLNRWTVMGREIDEQGVNGWLTYFGFPPVDPYSDKYRAYNAALLCADRFRRTYSIPLDEYEAHKEHYDGYRALGCTVEPVEDIGRVWIRGARTCAESTNPS